MVPKTGGLTGRIYMSLASSVMPDGPAAPSEYDSLETAFG